MNVEKIAKALRVYKDAKAAHDAAVAKLNAVQGEVDSAKKEKDRAFDVVLEVGTQLTR